MVPHVLFYQLLLIALVLICFIIHVWWPDAPRRASTTPLEPHRGRRKRSTEPKPFPGFIHKPLCEACEQAADACPQAPGAPLPFFPAPEDAGARSTPDCTSVPIQIASTTAGSDAAISALMAILAGER